MAIQEVTTSAKDVQIDLATASFSGTLVNWDEVNRGFEHVTEDFRPQSAGIQRYTTPVKQVPPLRIRITLGLGQTLLDLKEAFDDQVVTNFVMTGWPSHANMVAEYGALGVVSVSGVVGARDQGEIVLRYGLATTGYSPA